MHRSSVFVTLFTLLILGSAQSAYAATPWPSNGSVNLVTKTITLEYGEAPYARPVVTGFPNRKYADVWVGGTRERVTTASRANALLTARRTRNATVKLVIPHREVDVAGRVQVRHGLTLGTPIRSARRVSASGVVLPTKGHDVQVKLQRRYWGVWVTKQTQTVRTKDTGSFTAVFTADRYTGVYRVRASVAGDAVNAGKVALAACQ